jgi:hypothetical protein
MAISTFAELKASVADYLNRSDLTSVIPTFITLAESQINRDVRHWQMEEKASLTVNARYVARPADWIQTVRIALSSGSGGGLSLMSQQAMAEKRGAANDAAGTPAFYSHSESNFEFFPTPDSANTAELLYYQTVPALSDSATSNWLLVSAPDVYLYGTLIHSAPYLAEDGRTGVWAQMYGAAVNQLNLQSESSKTSGAGLKLRVRGLG